MSNNVLYSNMSSLPEISRGYLQRRKIDKLLKEAINYPLVTVTAGAGYGKTQAVSAFLRDSPIPFIWLQLSTLDNLTKRFWESFVYAIAIQNPYIAGRLATSGFPHTEAQFDDFLHRLADAVAEIGRIVFVFDDFHLIEEPSILRFFENFLNARLKELTAILISRNRINLNIPGKRTNKLETQIIEDDLRFSSEEITEYYMMQCIDVSAETINSICEKTEGWVAAVYLIGLSIKRNNIQSKDVIVLANQQIFEMIEDEFFSRYSKEVQTILIKLSVLDVFSLDLLKELVDIDIILEISKTNSFVYFDPITRNYRFHNLFSDFLSEKLVFLQDDKIQDTYQKIADWYYRKDYKVDALVYYEKCGQYDRICDILMHYEIDLPIEEANMFIQMIERIPEGFILKNPIMRVIHARLLLNNAHVLESIKEFKEIVSTYSALPDTTENRAILGEAYIFQAMISLLTTDFEFPRLFKLADECLPNGSSLVDSHLYVLNGNSALAIGSADKGEVRRFEDAMSYAVTFASRVMHGCCSGVDCLVHAEAAYYTGNTAKAESEAFKAIYRARQVGQNDIVCCSFFVLIRLSIASGSFEKAATYLAELREVAEKSNDCISFLDIFEGWFYVKLGDTGKVADWIKSEERSARIISPNSSCNDWFVRAYYLLQNENYYELSAYMEYLNELHNAKGFLLSRLEAKILKSITAYKTGELALSINALQEAYELAHANSLTMFFIEQGSFMRSVIDIAKQKGGHTIPNEWLDTISGKSNTYAKKLGVVKEQYKTSTGLIADKQYNLTGREREILRYLCQGLNRDEIAKSIFISVNTVKSSMQNIYNKLGAKNKADAVRIAMQVGLDH